MGYIKDQQHIEKILVVGPSWVGDMVMSQSLYKVLKKRNGNSIIHVLAPPWSANIVTLMPEVDQLINMPIGHGRLDLSMRKQIAQNLKQNNYDQAIILPGSLKSALIPWLAGIPKRTGWRGEFRYGLLNDIRTLNKASFPLMVQRYAALAYNKKNMCAINVKSDNSLKPFLRVDIVKAKQTLHDLFTLRNAKVKLLTICPGAEFGPAKRWPHYHYAELTKYYITKGWQVLLCGSDNDYQINQSILSILTPSDQMACTNTAGKTTLSEVVDILALSDLVISNDSGLMHLTAALNRPLVALYGPTSPEFTPPLNSNAKILRLTTGYSKVRRGNKEQGYHESLIDLTPDMVISAANG